MSDTGRKGLGEQIGEKVTPQSQKSNTQVASEKASGLGDQIAGTFQPSDNKSATQKLGDSTRSNANEGGSYLDSAKDTVSGAASSASDTLSGAADSVTGKTKETTNS